MGDHISKLQILLAVSILFDYFYLKYYTVIKSAYIGYLIE
jgi:hypothetical protein